jgi:hypothetical protein
LGHSDHSKDENKYLQNIEKLRPKQDKDTSKKKNGNFKMLTETRCVINLDGARHLTKSTQTKEEKIEKIEKVCTSNF